MRSFGLFVEISVVLAFACVICSQEVLPPANGTQPTPVPQNSSSTEVPKPPIAPVAPSNSSVVNTTTVVPPVTTTPAPNATVAPVTTEKPTPVTTPTPKPTAPPPVPTTVPPSTTTLPPVTTALPFQAPTTMMPDRSFDGLSFIGGMVLAIGLMAIAGVAFKFYRAREGNLNYFTL